MSDAEEPKVTPQTSRTRAISRSIVTLLKEHLGRGPVKAKTYIHEDSVLVLHVRACSTVRAPGSLFRV